MIKRILVGICDPQSSKVIAAYARELAQRFGAQVSVVTVTDQQRLTDVGPVAIGAGSFTKELVDERIEDNAEAIRQSLESLVRELEDASVPYRVLHENGEHYDRLIDASRYHDLMIFGLRGLFEHGVTDEPPDELVHLVESGARPILATGAEYRETRRVLIAYSGSLESARTMRHFASLNLWPDAQVRLVHFGRSSEAAMMLAEAHSYLKDYGFNVEVELIEEAAKAELLQQANDWQADLIVVGNSAKSLLRRRVFGETALNTMRESQLPLFLSQ